MDQLDKETDLSRERPSRRSRLSGRRTPRAIGRHRRTLPRLDRKNRAVEVRVVRVLDLTTLEGDPTYRADEGLLKLGAEVRPFRGQARVDIEAPAESQPGTAITAAILLGMGAILGGCGLAAGYFWRFPSALSAIIAILLFVSPVITYMGLRRR
jgi:hypothetical protein